MSPCSTEVSLMLMFQTPTACPALNITMMFTSNHPYILHQSSFAQHISLNCIFRGQSSHYPVPKNRRHFCHRNWFTIIAKRWFRCLSYHHPHIGESCLHYYHTSGRKSFLTVVFFLHNIQTRNHTDGLNSGVVRKLRFTFSKYRVLHCADNPWNH